jgi:hypothetical protein
MAVIVVIDAERMIEMQNQSNAGGGAKKYGHRLMVPKTLHRLPQFTRRGQQNTHHDQHNGDHHEQFNESESATPAGHARLLSLHAQDGGSQKGFHKFLLKLEDAIKAGSAANPAPPSAFESNAP